MSGIRPSMYDDLWGENPWQSNRFSKNDMYDYLRRRGIDHPIAKEILSNPGRCQELEREMSKHIGSVREYIKPPVMYPPPPPQPPSYPLGSSSTKQSDVPAVSAALNSNKKLLLLLE